MTYSLKPGIFLLAFLLAAATAAVYLPVTTHDFLYYDDDTYVFENPAVRRGITVTSLAWACTSTVGSNWQPLTWLSHMLDCMLFGLNPSGHHLTSLLLHTANALLLFLVLVRMTGARWQSLFVAALFALHPLHVESVAWIAERKDVLSTLFWMLTLWAYAAYAERPGAVKYSLMVVWFAMGLLAKQMIVTLPFVLLLLDIWPLRRFEQRPGIKKLSLIFEKLPLFALSAIMSAVIFLVQQHSLAIKQLPLHVRCANALSAYLRYVAKMFWPADLAVPYLHTGTGGTGQAAYLAFAAAFLLGISALAVLRAKKCGYFFTGWFWYLGTLVPVAGFVQTGYHSHADRYTYIPLTGLFIIIAWGVPSLFSRWRLRKWALPLLAGGTVAALIPATATQLRYWRNTDTLFSHTIEVMPDNAVAHNALGYYFFKQGKAQEAYGHLLRAVQSNPRYTKAQYNLGCVLAGFGRLDEAADCFRNVLSIYTNDVKSHTRLGRILLMQGKTDEAIEHFRQALTEQPDYGEARHYMRKALAAQAAPADMRN